MRTRLPRFVYRQRYKVRGGYVRTLYYVRFVDWKGKKRVFPAGDSIRLVMEIRDDLLKKNLRKYDFDSDKTQIIKDATTMIGGSQSPTMFLSGEQLRSLRAAVIYMWVRNEQVLYVGMSSTGLSRPLDIKHHRLANINDDDTFVAWGIPTVQQAKDLERELIRKFRPALNSANFS